MSYESLVQAFESIENKELKEEYKPLFLRIVKRMSEIEYQWLEVKTQGDRINCRLMLDEHIRVTVAFDKKWEQSEYGVFIINNLEDVFAFYKLKPDIKIHKEEAFCFHYTDEKVFAMTSSIIQLYKCFNS